MLYKSEEHNLLIVSDLHIAEGLRAEACETCHGLEAFMYDGAFARFLRYHEGMRRDAVRRLKEFQKAQKGGRLDEAAVQEAESLARPWKLVMAGDVFDFWDVVRVPGDAESLRAALDDAIHELGFESAGGRWLHKLKMRLAGVWAGLQTEQQDYDEIRAELDSLNLHDGRQRRTVEELTWWTEVLVAKRGQLSRRERRHGLGTTWQEVVWKLTLIYRGHAEFFGALAWFIACGNEVILLKGNHDIELHWPQVHDGHLPHLLADAYADLHAGGPLGPTFGDYPSDLMVDVEGNPLPDVQGFRQLLPTYAPRPGSHTGQKRFVFEDWYYCEPDLVYVEHGNQYEPADSSVSFLDPTMPSDRSRIELPWGAYMVRYFYNKIVAVHPFAVNVKPEQKIIQWMTRFDLFRLLGIIVAELVDIVRGLLRAVKQGFRATWIWGDHSISGLVPLLMYDSVQARIYLSQWWRHLRDPSAQPPSKQDVKALSARTLLHLGAFGALLSLLLIGAGWLLAWSWTGWLGIPLLVFAALTCAGAIWSVRLGGDRGTHSLGELLLQIGVVGAVAALIIGLTVGRMMGWHPFAAVAIAALFAAAAAIGAWLIWKTGRGESGLFRSTWQARCLRSAASLFLELGFLATLVGAYYQFWAANSEPAGTWLQAGLALFVAGWPAYRLHGMFVNRHWLEKQARGPAERIQRGVRHEATVLVALFGLSLLLPPVAWLVARIIDSLLADGGSTAVTGVADFARGLHERMTDATLFGMPLLVALAIAMAVVILVECVAHWFAERWSKRQPRQMASPAQKQHDRLGLEAQYWALGYQQDEIKELARAEQRRWLGGVLGMLMLFLPIASLALLALAIAGGLAALLSHLSPVREAVEPLKALGVSALFGFGYWLLGQFIASRQRHDPQSGFGDLFYRMATGISSIAAATHGWTSGTTMGRPRYFVFGHDHWADSKLLPRSRQSGRSEEKQWYVNSGTWLRGYVEEWRQQEVNENHSTFVQIIPGLGEHEAPRVLRWNDGANQPEQIVRRKEPESTTEMFWSRWEGGWVWVLVWASLLAVAWRLAPSDWMAGLWPLVWTLGLWLVSWFLVNGVGILLSLVSQPAPAPDPRDVTDMHCHVGVVGEDHPEWGRMSPEYREMFVFKTMLLYGGLDEHQVSDASLRAFTKKTIEESHVGHVVCLALDPVYDLAGNQHKELSHVWVSNEYILGLQRDLPDKVLFGASVHPYDPDFEKRVRSYVEQGAVLLKWLPSAQQIDLAEDKVRKALEFLAKARNGKPLPLLLHVGPEYAIPSMDPSTASYDYLTWTWWDGLRSRLPGVGKPLRPVKSLEIRANLQAGLSAGAVIIFAHCGLPYFSPRWFGRFFEHSELRTIRRYLKRYPAQGGQGKGQCYTDVSALITPFRRSYFSAVRRLPRESLLFGSDFPTPVFELSAGIGENLQDLRAVLEGEVERVLIPEDNLIDVNYREVQHVFPGHPMFRNFDRLRH